MMRLGCPRKRNFLLTIRLMPGKIEACAISEAAVSIRKEQDAPPEHQVELQVKQLSCRDFSSFAGLVSSGFLPRSETRAFS
jgi:hypothetical protein